MNVTIVRRDGAFVVRVRGFGFVTYSAALTRNEAQRMAAEIGRAS